MSKKTVLLAFVATSLTSPAWAGTADNVRQAVTPSALDALGAMPSGKERQNFASIFAAIDGRNWAEAARLIDGSPAGPMKSMARAELYLAAGSPKVEVAQLEELLQEAPWLPQAEQLERMAIKRGAAVLPQRPGTRRFSFLGSAPKRDLPGSVPTAAALRSQIQELIKADNPSEAEALLIDQSATLDAAGLAELRYRVAWSYYIENDDTNAQRVAAEGRLAAGEWGIQSEWVHGLANWRLGNHREAFSSFDIVSRMAGNDELRSAALFWSSRAAMASRQPQQVSRVCRQPPDCRKHFTGCWRAKRSAWSL